MTPAKIEYYNKSGHKSEIYANYHKFDNYMVVETFGSDKVFIIKIQNLISINELKEDHERK